jgi:hypothetical protein
MDPEDLYGTVLPKNIISSFHNCIAGLGLSTACYKVNCGISYIRVSIKAAAGF